MEFFPCSWRLAHRLFSLDRGTCLYHRLHPNIVLGTCSSRLRCFLVVDLSPTVRNALQYNPMGFDQKASEAGPEYPLKAGYLSNRFQPRELILLATEGIEPRPLKLRRSGGLILPPG